MITLILCVILIALLGFLLLTPFQLWIDSTQNRYQLRWGLWANVGLLPIRDDLLLQLWVLGWRKSYSLLALLHRQAKARAQPKAQTRAAKRSGRSLSWRRFRKLLQSFKVKHWRLDIDTDDVVWNAYLFPLSYVLQRAHYPVQVNYEGRVEVELLVENRPIRVIRALFF